MSKKTIGVLSLQGCVDPHRPHIEALALNFLKLRSADDFKRCDAFILPGGESSTMIKNLENLDLWDLAQEEFSRKPCWGICAGSILLAKKVQGLDQKSFALLDLEVERNAFGRQLESFQTEQAGYLVSFIRAPQFRKLGESVEVLSEYAGQATWIRQGNKMASSFHPELTHSYPSPMHQSFSSLL